MRRFLLAAAFLPAVAYAQPGPRLRSVLLSSGVAQLQWEAQVDGSAPVPLDLPLDQVSDVLKSLRVDDPAGGTPQLRLPGRQPLADAFRALPFQPDALASAQALLGALVGADIRVPAAGIAGRIVAVSPFDVRLPNGGEGTLTRHRLSVATETGIETVVLEDVPGIELADPTLRAQLARPLARSRHPVRRTAARRSLVLLGGAGVAGGAAGPVRLRGRRARLEGGLAPDLGPGRHRAPPGLGRGGERHRPGVGQRRPDPRHRRARAVRPAALRPGLRTAA